MKEFNPKYPIHFYPVKYPRVAVFEEFLDEVQQQVRKYDPSAQFFVDGEIHTRLEYRRLKEIIEDTGGCPL